MNSTRFVQKQQALVLRKEGTSIRDIEAKLSIPRSTLSGWLKDVKLTKNQERKLKERRDKGLKRARAKAVLWHNAQKKLRLETAEREAMKVLDEIKTSDKRILELALSIMYLGEGSKKNGETALGSSDPAILKFFLTILKKVYRYKINNVRCELNLRADQNAEDEKLYWSKELYLPIENFKQVTFDKRTVGKKTYPGYHGVCHLRCGRVDIQRRLIYLAKGYCDTIVRS